MRSSGIASDLGLRTSLKSCCGCSPEDPALSSGKPRRATFLPGLKKPRRAQFVSHYDLEKGRKLPAALIAIKTNLKVSLWKKFQRWSICTKDEEF